MNVSPDNSGTATVSLSLAPVPSLLITRPAAGQFQLSWPAAAVGYVLEQATNLAPPVAWSPVANPVVLISNQNVVTITNADSPAFYRLKQ